MDQNPAREPLLSSEGVKTACVKNTASNTHLVKWFLKAAIWVIFIAWVSIIFLFPAESVNTLFEKYNQATSKTVFGISGSLFLLFSGPILAIAFLSVAVLIISREDEVQEKKNPNIRLWTFPVLVDGPFGVVSAAEFIGILLFAVYILWAIYAYTMRNLSLISEYQLTSQEKSYLMLVLSGLRFGTIGLFCLAFLFLPVARGSVLLRLIDIPFEHATKYHVWMGHLTMLIFTLHGLCYVIAWAMKGTLLQEILEWKSIGVANLAGVISLLAGLLLWVTSLPPVRKIYFELFFYTHQLYIVFVIFFALHVGDFVFCIASGGIFLFILDRFLRFCQSRRRVDVISATSLPCGTVELVLSKPGNLRYNALSFIFLKIQELSWLQWHPFSVSSSPLDGKHHMSILIKVLGEWTGKLKGNISSISEEEHSEELLLKPNSNITAYVEGPYGHDLPYHLTYENLILVAGGIGISPFLAILSDILHRKREGKPCLPSNIVIVWAVKKSNEIPLLSMIDMESVSPSFSSKLNIDIRIYVTRESMPPLEEVESQNKAIDSSAYPASSRNSMSVLVGTGNNVWSGLYIVSSTVGFILLIGLVDAFYILPYGISSWWFKGLLFLASMVVGVVIFGGLVVVLWDAWEKIITAKDDGQEVDKVESEELEIQTDSFKENLACSSIIHYGSRPDLQEIFGSIGETWGHVDVGVIVCGPASLTTSVAKECRSLNISRKLRHPVFHFHSHSFDL